MRIGAKTIPIRLKKSQQIQAYLDVKISQSSVHVIDTVSQETSRKIWDILSEKGSQLQLNAVTVHNLVHKSFAKFNHLSNGVIKPDDRTLLHDVERMYGAIWNDAAKDSKKSRWAAIKRKNVSDGPPDGSDLVILATAAKLAQADNVELLTFDHDFIAFSEEINQTFNVMVLDGWQL